MADEFSPLLPPGAASVSDAEPVPAAFSPMLTPESSGSLKAGSGSGQVHSHGTHRVSVERDQDQITRIRVHCRCGEIIELDCTY